MMTMTVQQNAGYTAANARALIAHSFTFIMDEVTKYPVEYGLKESKPETEEKLVNDEAEKEKEEHFQPPAAQASELEGWNKAFNFVKSSIKPFNGV